MALFSRPKIVSNVRVGKAQVRRDASSHVSGVREGNAKGNLRWERGIRRKGVGGRGTARRSTGIRPLKHNAILPGIMPNISPP